MPLLNHPDGAIEYVHRPGRAPGPTVVFLHEGLGSIGQWGMVPASFAARTGLPTLVYSRHGYGGSGGTGPTGTRYLHTQAREVLPWILDELEVRTPPVLIGHSDGASIATVYASEYPVRALVLIAPHIVVEEVTLRGIRQTAHDFDAIAPSLRLHHDSAEALFDRWSNVWLSDEFQADFDLTGCLPRITAPQLVIQGEHDKYGTARQPELIAEHTAGPTSLALLPDTGHHPHLEATEKVLELICTTLSSGGHAPQRLG
ncbi:alpha/beta fold hydrolase [Nocardia sp. NPDC058176]|uniref:alpha/beta fold hydrolase n=1 Tax=Nocardia sp. NPDC058176 TaxID=3346368 RepID=UPI0036DEB98F